MTKPSLFIGSSLEGLDFARAVRSLLSQDAEVTMWNEGFFGLGSTFIETLINALPRFDFAILVLTPDDLVNSREAKTFGPRDNVIFELGLFMGRLGRSRTFILHQADAKIKIPTDLSGMTTATYEWPRNDGNHKSAVGAACDNIREIIRVLGVIETKANTITESRYLTLKKLSTGRFGHFIISSDLRRELRQLRNLDLITVKGAVGQLPDEGKDLSEFVTVTAIGKQFIEFREALDKLDKEAKPPNNSFNPTAR
jgi:hypothetical protein